MSRIELPGQDEGYDSVSEPSLSCQVREHMNHPVLFVRPERKDQLVEVGPVLQEAAVVGKKLCRKLHLRLVP